MDAGLTSDGVTALAPDAKVAAAGRKLGVPESWESPGRSADALWGKCRGSAVYQVRVDLSDLAVKCSRPSRKHPCKHGIGLLFFAIETPFPEAPAPDWVTDWLLLGKRTGKLVVEPPENVDDERDLPGDKAPYGMGKKAWRITQVLAVVPPCRWEERFGVEPEVMVAAVKGSEWEAPLLMGWGRAAKRYGGGGWALPIWRRCHERPESEGAGSFREWERAWEAALSLVPSMSRRRFAAEFRKLLREDGMTDRLAATLSRLPAPWDEELSMLYLGEMRKHVLERFARNRDENDPWLRTPQQAARRIPPSCLQHASFPQPDEIPIEQEFSNGQVVRYEPYHLRYWREELTKFEETLELRRKLEEEIPL